MKKITSFILFILAIVGMCISYRNESEGGFFFSFLSAVIFLGLFFILNNRSKAELLFAESNAEFKFGQAAKVCSICEKRFSYERPNLGFGICKACRDIGAVKKAVSHETS